MLKAIFLDRDGVVNKPIIINRKTFAPLKFENFSVTENLKENLNLFKKLEYKTFIITNQPEISKGNLKKSELVKMHNFLMQNFQIDKILYCPHSNNHNCECRKPKPGMINSLNKLYDLSINFNKSFIIGDRKKDIDMGVVTGCKTIFIDYDYDEKKPEIYNFKCKNLTEATEYIVSLNEN